LFISYTLVNIDHHMDVFNEGVISMIKEYDLLLMYILRL